MTEAQIQLMQRLETFQFDEADTSFTFAERLAQENCWLPEFTERAIVEYRRFMLLAVIAGHPVSPPEVIDQVWHLHLLYSRSYWQTFCPQVLGQPMHHEPTRGGTNESAKFTDWYTRTLTSYENAFGEPPPMDV